MQIGRYRFAPPWWGVAAMLLGVGVFVAAGIWQIERGLAKQAIVTQRMAARKTPAQPLAVALNKSETSDVTTLYGRDYVASGHYDTKHQILLDNQKNQARTGYRVWTPLIMDNGKVVLVDRGWVPLGPGGRDNPPVPAVPEGPVSVKGLFRNLPKPGIRLGEPAQCEPTVWPRVLNYPTIRTVRCLYPEPVVNGLILLDEEAPHGFVRNWQTHIGGMPPMRHYGYAFQWFALAVAVVVVFLVVNRKRIK